MVSNMVCEMTMRENAGQNIKDKFVKKVIFTILEKNTEMLSFQR